jgi:hypothetical protein
MRLGLRSLQVLQRPRLGIEERWIQVSFFDARRFRGQSRGLTRRPGYAQGSRHVEAQLGLSLLARADDERAGGSERGSAIPRNAIPCDERRDVHAVLRMRQRELARLRSPRITASNTASPVCQSENSTRYPWSAGRPALSP